MDAPRRRWVALGLVTAVEFLIFLDIAIVNIALPAIQADIGLDEQAIAWTVTAYQLVFGGTLLLGGRLADVFGPRRLYRAGLALFTLGSLGAGLASDGTTLVIARGVQGLGAAALAPTALALLESVFRDTSEYHRAFGIWSAMRSAGASSGVVLGGLITAWFGWPWTFLINVPVCLLALALSGSFLPEATTGPRRRIDLPGAISVTAGLLLVVGAVSGGTLDLNPLGWIALVSGVVLLALFPLIESRAAQPLLPMRLLRIRDVSVSATAGFLIGASHLALFFYLSLYLQWVAGYDPLTAGLAVLPVGLGVLVVGTWLLPRLIPRLGHRRLLAAGALALGAAQVLLARAPAAPEYAVDVLPALMLAALGLPAVFVSVTAPAVHAVPPEDRGVTAGLVTMTQRIGGGVGIALITAIAASAATRTTGVDQLQEIRLALVMAAVVSLATVVLVVLSRDVKRSGHQPETVAESPAAGGQK